MYDVLIVNGKVVGPRESKLLDVAIEGEKNGRPPITERMARSTSSSALSLSR